MLKRTLTTLIAAPIVIYVTYLGGIPFLLFVCLLALFSINEFYHLVKLKGFSPLTIQGSCFALIFIIFAYQTLRYPAWEASASAILTIAVILTFITGVFSKKSTNVIGNIAVTLLGMLYVGWLFSFLILLRSLTLHGAYFFFLVATVWANDTASYLVGVKFGRVKLIPTLSPKKTWEGAIAGFLTCLAAAFIFGYFANIDLTHSLIMGAIIGILAPISDLAESLIKRDVGVKDSGIIVFGHGGVLDRMDSFILTAPIMYYYLAWVVLV